MIDNSEFKYVVLEGIEEGNRFYTVNHSEPEKIANGEIAYKILGYANTSEEALSIIGKDYQDAARTRYLNKLFNMLREGEIK